MYGLTARHQEIILADPVTYSLGTRRTNAYLPLGKMSPEKGNLEAMWIARKLGLKLYVVGGRMPTDDDSYERLVQKLCTKPLVYVGDCAESGKIRLLQTCKALIYAVGQLEIHSHKSVEAMMCGCPVIAYDMGALKEVIGPGGMVVQTCEQFEQAILEVGASGQLPTPTQCRNWAMKWAKDTVVAEVLTLLEQVAGGLRW